MSEIFWYNVDICRWIFNYDRLRTALLNYICIEIDPLNLAVDPMLFGLSVLCFVWPLICSHVFCTDLIWQDSVL